MSVNSCLDQAVFWLLLYTTVSLSRHDDSVECRLDIPHSCGTEAQGGHAAGLRSHRQGERGVGSGPVF